MGSQEVTEASWPPAWPLSRSSGRDAEPAAISVSLLLEEASSAPLGRPGTVPACCRLHARCKVNNLSRLFSRTTQPRSSSHAGLTQWTSRVTCSATAFPTHLLCLQEQADATRFTAPPVQLEHTQAGPHLAEPGSGRSAGGGSVCLRLLRLLPLCWRTASTSPPMSLSKSIRLWLVVSWAHMRLMGEVFVSGLLLHTQHEQGACGCLQHCMQLRSADQGRCVPPACWLQEHGLAASPSGTSSWAAFSAASDRAWLTCRRC